MGRYREFLAAERKQYKTGRRNQQNAGATAQIMRETVLRLTGDSALIRMLESECPKIARAAMRNALAKAARYVAKMIKAQIPADQKRLKVVIGSRNGKSRKDKFSSKAGPGVGAAFKKKVKRKGDKPKGVGISGNNIHWLVLGTDDRFTKKTKKHTGRIPRAGGGSTVSYMATIVPDGFQAAKATAGQIIRDEITVKLQTLAVGDRR